jgi:hypothetical protein
MIVVERGESDTNHKVQYPFYFISEVLSDIETLAFPHHEVGLCPTNHISQAFPLLSGTLDRSSHFINAG